MKKVLIFLLTIGALHLSTDANAGCQGGQECYYDYDVDDCHTAYFHEWCVWIPGTIL